MAIINRDGLFKGKRLRKCSARARLYWPHFYLLSNGFARIELDFETLADEFASFRDNAPCSKDLAEYFAEYESNHLLIAYESKGQRWGQWDTPRSHLKDFKTASDKRSPAPPEPIYTAWLQEQHGPDWKDFHWDKASSGEQSRSMEVSTTLEKDLGKSSQTVDQDLPLGVGGGDGVGEGKGKGEERDLSRPLDPLLGKTSKTSRMEEKGTRVATETVPDNSDLMVQMLVDAHPRNLSPIKSQQEAVAAIMRESKKYGGKQQAYEYLLERVKLYASITAKYSSLDKNFIPGADTWFREERYQADEKLWVKGESVPKPPNILDRFPQGRNGLDILAEREAEIAR